MNKLEDNDKDLQRIILNISKLKMQLSDVVWETFNPSLVTGAIISASEPITSSNQIF